MARSSSSAAARADELAQSAGGTYSGDGAPSDPSSGGGSIRSNRRSRPGVECKDAAADDDSPTDDVNDSPAFEPRRRRMVSILSPAFAARRPPPPPPHPPSRRHAPKPSRHIASCQCRSPFRAPFRGRATLTISPVARQSPCRVAQPMNSRVSSHHRPRPRACGKVTRKGISTYRPRIPSPDAGRTNAAARSPPSSSPRRHATLKGSAEARGRGVLSSSSAASIGSS